MEQSERIVDARIPANFTIKHFVPIIVTRTVRQAVDRSARVEVAWLDNEQTTIRITITGITSDVERQVRGVLAQAGYGFAESPA